MAAMEYFELEGCPLTNIASPFCKSVFWQIAGRLNKYAGTWIVANKRIYLTEGTLEKLRVIKNTNL